MGRLEAGGSALAARTSVAAPTGTVIGRAPGEKQQDAERDDRASARDSKTTHTTAPALRPTPCQPGHTVAEATRARNAPRGSAIVPVVQSIAPTDKVDLLIVGAHGPDLRGLRSHLGERLDGAIRGLRITAKTVGIGIPVAGPSTAKRVFQLEPKAVIHLGTCGVFPGFEQYRPHDVIVGTQVTLVDHAVNAYRASFPEPMQTTLATHTMLSQGLAACGPRTHMAGIGSTLALTVDDTLAAEVPQRCPVHAESLEAFGIAHACQLAQTPFACVLGATHVVGSRGRDDWRQFERQSTISAAEVLIAWIMAGAQGMPHARPA